MLHGSTLLKLKSQIWLYAIYILLGVLGCKSPRVRAFPEAKRRLKSLPKKVRQLSPQKKSSSLRPNSLSSSIQWLSRTVIPNHCLIEFPWGTPHFYPFFRLIFVVTHLTHNSWTLKKHIRWHFPISASVFIFFKSLTSFLTSFSSWPKLIQFAHRAKLHQTEQTPTWRSADGSGTPMENSEAVGDTSASAACQCQQLWEFNRKGGFSHQKLWFFHSFLMFFVWLPEGNIRLTSEILGSSQGAESHGLTSRLQLCSCRSMQVSDDRGDCSCGCCGN